MVKLFRDILLITFGSFIYALALTGLAIPNNLAEGGVAGASIILHYALDWSVGITNFLLTGIILVVGYRYLPKRTIRLTLITAPLISFFLFITENIMEPLGDPLVSAVFAGFFIGIGTGMILRTGSSMGGSTVIAQMFHYNLGWDLTRTNLVIDIAIVTSGLLIIGPLNTMYTIIALYIGKKSTDLVLEGLDSRKAVSVISNKAMEISEAVISEMRTSATVFEGYGSYMLEERDMTYIIISKHQLMKLKRVINEVDDEAFVVVHDVREAFGGSFSWITRR
ncbi:YitT family protein [Sporosarcina pasteurii]|nr:YitT family protein [Sporosarcina pasteurii]